MSKSLNAVGINTNAVNEQLGQANAVNNLAISKAKKGASKLFSSATKGVMNVFGVRKNENPVGNGSINSDASAHNSTNGNGDVVGKRNSIDSSKEGPAPTSIKGMLENSFFISPTSGEQAMLGRFSKVFS